MKLAQNAELSSIQALDVSPSIAQHCCPASVVGQVGKDVGESSDGHAGGPWDIHMRDQRCICLDGFKEILRELHAGNWIFSSQHIVFVNENGSLEVVAVVDCNEALEHCQWGMLGRDGNLLTLQSFQR